MSFGSSIGFFLAMEMLTYISIRDIRGLGRGDVFVIKNVLVSAFTEEFVPFISAEVGHLLGINCDRGKPIVKDDVKLWSNGSCVEVQDKWDTGGMIGTQANEDLTFGPGGPTWEFLSVGDLLVQDIHRASPYMMVVEFGMRPSGFGEDVVGTDACRGIRHVVVEKDGVIHCQRPEASVGDVGPMDGTVEHHCSCDAHYRLYTSLGASVVMMSSNSSEVGDLSKGFEVCREFLGGKTRMVV